MPPKAKFKEEEIITAALYIVRHNGIDALTARALAEKLGSSARPIFTVFQSMDEVKHETMQAAKEVYNVYVKKGLTQSPAFKGVGIEYIQFSVNEPKLFQLLFMSENTAPPKLSEVLSIIDDNHAQIVASIQSEYNLSIENAWEMYRHLWIYTHGIASLCATKVCQFTESEIDEMISIVFKSILKEMKAGADHDSC